MIELIKDKEDCCGCTACISICPNQAISMKSDDEGFLYPFINELLCTECGLCKKVCPIQNELSIDRLHSPLVFAIKHKDDNIRMASSSGGAYTAILSLVLENYRCQDNIDMTDGCKSNIIHPNNNICRNSCSGSKGICYGVEYNSDFVVRHNSASVLSECNKFRGSKYVQSELENVFLRIKSDLLDEKTVLFTGTPCQTAGLSKFLELSKVKTKNLILNDIVCHGTPSPLLWRQYVEFLETKYKSKLKAYTFRNKEIGWRDYNVKAVFENGKYILNTSDVNIYSKIFSSNMALRPSCYVCKYSNLMRPSDITIGDFWGIEKCLPEFEDNKGVSLLLLSTQKGELIFEQMKSMIIFEQSNTTDCMQHNLEQPTKCPIGRDEFWKDYHANGFEYIARKYAGLNYSSIIKNYIKLMLKKK